MIVAVDQPNYIPWKGYFDIIHDVDLFVLYNDVQYTSRDWRNRNRIIMCDDMKWLSVPVGQKVHRLICDVMIPDPSWQRNHYETLKHAYGKAPFFKKYKEFLEDVYLGHVWKYLYELNQYIIERISKDFLGLNTRFVDSRAYQTHGKKHERLLGLVQAAGGDIYESGPAAKNYIISKDYLDNGIRLLWKSYDGYPEYPQMSSEFHHEVSILDLLFNVGDEAPYYIWGWRDEIGKKSWIEEETI